MSDYSHEALDASVFQSSFETERTISQPELRLLFDQARQILHDDGTDSAINGVAARVSKSHVAVTVGSDEYCARVFEFKPRSVKHEKPDQMMPGIVLAHSEITPVLSPNPTAMQFGSLGDMLRLQFGDGIDGLSPLVNDAARVEVFSNMLQAISNRKSEALEQTALEKRRAHERRAKRTKHIATSVAIVAIVGAGVSGGVYGLSKVDSRSDIEKFDDAYKSLDGGTALSVGTTGNPDYSIQLATDSNLSATSLPDISQPSGRSSYKTQDITLGKLRETFIRSNKVGENCRSFKINPAGAGIHPRLKVWTDFHDKSTGQSLASELSVSYALDQGTLCWTGLEKKFAASAPTDYPRIVVQLVKSDN